MTDAGMQDVHTYTVTQLATMLQLKPATIRAKARAGTWPHLAFGPRTIRFTEAHYKSILSIAEATPPQPQPAGRRTRRKP